MRITLSNSNNGLNYEMEVLNNSESKYPYRGYLHGSFYEHGIESSLAIFDMTDKTALALSMKRRYGRQWNAGKPHIAEGYTRIQGVSSEPRQLLIYR